MSQYGEETYGQPQYGTPGSNIPFFLALLVNSLPPNYRPTDFRGFNVREFLERMLQPNAEDLATANDIIETLDQFVLPDSAPEEWLDWMLAEWWGWHLIPDRYPVDPTDLDPRSKRRVLANLHSHYAKRYTVDGIRELLGEFGIVAEVYDKPLFVGGYYGSYGSRWPLHVRVRILGYQPFERPQNNYARNYYRGAIAYTTRQIITEQFVMDLLRWERAAGVEFIAEWRTATQPDFRIQVIIDDDEIIRVPIPLPEPVGPGGQFNFSNPANSGLLSLLD